ncbi:uncharacterized protein LOC105432404 isoform X1 [Pogonomyrmex barbatus]|uniref:Uncharacterized protein LOC105432404 isoform X1 n=1 Tax=Pogonomyrmex barbatus TaxID=144034 RepID=A0A8N1S9Q3_9HYME|nr:uncharacterized protein LOC105432404 isoform X1 [Pogonomyrmex barbatus]
MRRLERWLYAASGTRRDAELTERLFHGPLLSSGCVAWRCVVSTENELSIHFRFDEMKKRMKIGKSANSTALWPIAPVSKRPEVPTSNIECALQLASRRRRRRLSSRRLSSRCIISDRNRVFL